MDCGLLACLRYRLNHQASFSKQIMCTAFENEPQKQNNIFFKSLKSIQQ